MPTIPPTYSTSNMTIEFTQGFLEQLTPEGIMMVLRPQRVSGRDGYVLEQVPSEREYYTRWLRELHIVAESALPPEMAEIFFAVLSDRMMGFEARVRAEVLQEGPQASVARSSRYDLEPPPEGPEDRSASESGARVSRYSRDPVI